MKIKLFATLTIAASIMFASCSTSPSGGGKLKTDMDSLSYAFGITATQGLDMYLIQLGIEGSNEDEFYKGFNEGLKINTKDKKVNARFIGRSIGVQVANDIFDNVNGNVFGIDSTQSLNKSQFLAGFIAAARNGNLKINRDDIDIEMFVQTRTAALQESRTKELYKEHMEQNENFLAENKNKPGVITTESGLQYEVIKMGNGPKPEIENTVRVHYAGTLIDGTEFDSSITRGQPAEFPIQGVISGWTEALQLMPVGSKFKLYIPQDLAYGASGSGLIEPYSTLIFEVELLDIVR